METKKHSDWYDELNRRAVRLGRRIGPGPARRYHLDLLLRAAAKLDELSPACAECRAFQTKLTEYSARWDTMTTIPDDYEREYTKTINDIVRHLQRKHHLILPGQNTGIWLVLGAGVGTALGVVYGNIALGVALGVSGGLLIGGLLDAYARRQGKVI